MPRLKVNLRIDREEYLRWYRAEAQDVVATAVDGRTVKFPANVLQPFITHSGVNGMFEIEFTDTGKFTSIVRLG